MPLFRFVLPVLGLLLLNSSLAFGQFRTLYNPDTADIQNVGYFTAEEVIETGIPGREVAITGSVNGFNPQGNSIQGGYLLQANSLGDPQMFSYYYDTAFFLVQGTRSFSLAYDQQESFYLAMGSNDNCLVVKTDTAGEVDWIVDSGHHDYQGIVYHDGMVAALGQNESLLGDHDFSMGRLDSTGNSPGADMMFGTTGFDIPQGCARTSDGYIMVGESNNNKFGCMVVKANDSLGLTWSRVFKLPGKDVFGQQVVTLPNDEGYCMTGWVRSSGGAPDSIFVMEVDTAGNWMWMNVYGLDSASNMLASSIDRVPGSGDLIIGGNYRGSYFRKAFVMSVDEDGNFLWAQDYGDPDTTVEDYINDVTVTENGENFYAVGNYVKFDGQFTNSVICWKASTATGEIPCESALFLGQRSASPFDGDVAFTTPYLNNDPYPLVPVTQVNMLADVICFVQVSNEDPFVTQNVLRVVNPAGQDIVIFHDLGLQTGWLELRDVQGQLLLQSEVVVGSDRLSLPAEGLARGLYFLTLRNASEVFATRKVLVQP